MYLEIFHEKKTHFHKQQTQENFFSSTKTKYPTVEIGTRDKFCTNL